MAEPPKTLWLGMTTGEWPVSAFVDERHAMNWLGQSSRRRVWKAEIRGLDELRLVKPEPYFESVVTKEASADG